MTTPSGPAKNLVRAFTILDTIATAIDGKTLTEIAEDTELPEATAHRLLKVLESVATVRATPSGRYLLGRHCLHLGSAYLASIDVRSESIESMTKLTEVTGETTHLGILDDSRVVYIEKVESPHPVRMYSRVGLTNPAASTALGKAILAWSEQSLVDQIISLGIPARTPRTVTEPDDFQEELWKIRRRGYSLDDMENEEGIRCAAAPVLDHSGSPVAAISLSGPGQRIPRRRLEELGAAVADTAAQISSRIGYSGSSGEV